MNCPDCERPMNESMDKKYEYFNCPRCGFEVCRSSWDAMDRYWLKEKYSKYTNLIIWQKLKESKKEKKNLKEEGAKKMDRTEMRCGDCVYFKRQERELEGICAQGHGIFKQPSGALPLAYRCFDDITCIDYSPKKLNYEDLAAGLKSLHQMLSVIGDWHFTEQDLKDIVEILKR